MQADKENQQTGIVASISWSRTHLIKPILKKEET